MQSVESLSVPLVATADPKPVTLATLPLRREAVVAEVGGTRGFRRRLMELGLIPGSRVRVMNVAPLGDPMELEVRGCRLSIRRTEAEVVRVHP